MTTQARIVDIDDEVITIKANEVYMTGFSNVGTSARIGAIILVEITLWGDINIEQAPSSQKKLHHLCPGLSYEIWGTLDVENKVISSVFDFEIDEKSLAEFSYLDQKAVVLSMERFEFCILSEAYSKA